MKHKDKLKLARKIEGKHKKGFSIFDSEAWTKRKEAIAKRVKRNEKKPKFKILDDKGKEHKVGEIFQSNTLTLKV